MTALRRRRGREPAGTVRCILPSQHLKDGRFTWYRLVHGVTPELPRGYAFSDGEFVVTDTQVDLPIGGVLVAKEPIGLKRNPRARWHWTRISANGVEPPGGEGWHSYPAREFLDFRDAVAAAVAAGAPE